MSKKSSKKGKLLTFLNDDRFKVTLALVLLGICGFMLISFTSYFFTWKVDQNIEWSSNVKGIEGLNWASKMGALAAKGFIFNNFGIASFFFPFILFLLGFRLLKVPLLPFGRTMKMSVVGLPLLSIILGFLFKRDTNPGTFIGSGLGGYHGHEMADWMKMQFGVFATTILLIIMTFLFLMFSFPGFLGWFIKTIKSLKMIRIPAFLKRENKIEKDDDDENISDDAEVKDINPFIEQNENNIENSDEDDEDGEIDEEEISSSNIPVYDPNIKFTINTTANNEDSPADESDEENFVMEDLDALGAFDPTLDLSRYKMPPIELLADHKSENSVVTDDEHESNKKRIVETLEHYGVKIDSIEATPGPTVTLYEIVPAHGVRSSKIKNLENDIALRLAARGIRIIVPMPGRGTIGIEVPNEHPEIVSMRSIVASRRFQEAKMELPIALGKTISNDPFVFDLTKMPHLLVAGSTGQGKSVGLNAIIASILYKKHPSQVKLVMVDPKSVEFPPYEKIENHYLAKLPDAEDAIITDTQKVIYTINSLCTEMDTRYSLLKDAGVRNIKEYNTKFIARKLNPNLGHRYLPYIVVVIDEYADLVMTAGKDVELPIARLAQKARAAGIHLIIATQRPTTTVISGVIKANFPARIAFRVISQIDSRTILDVSGADQLIGRGDLLFTSGGELTRVQCAFIDIPEIEDITSFIGNQQGYPTALLLPEYTAEDGAAETKDVDLSKKDELFEDAARLLVMHQQGSTSLIQRKFSIGFARSGRIMDQLEAAGIVGPNEGSKARKVLFTDLSSLEIYLNKLNE